MLQEREKQHDNGPALVQHAGAPQQPDELRTRHHHAVDAGQNHHIGQNGNNSTAHVHTTTTDRHAQKREAPPPYQEPQPQLPPVRWNVLLCLCMHACMYVYRHTVSVSLRYCWSCATVYMYVCMHTHTLFSRLSVCQHVFNSYMHVYVNACMYT